MAKIYQGTVIRKEICDRSGKNKKPHPIVILSRNDVIATKDELVGVVASHTAAKMPNRDGHFVHLPHVDAANSSTGFTKITVAVCSWTEKIKKSEIKDDEIIGFVGPRFIEPIIEKVKEIHRKRMEEQTARCDPTLPAPPVD